MHGASANICSFTMCLFEHIWTFTKTWFNKKIDCESICAVFKFQTFTTFLQEQNSQLPRPFFIHSNILSPWEAFSAKWMPSCWFIKCKQDWNKPCKSNLGSSLDGRISEKSYSSTSRKNKWLRLCGCMFKSKSVSGSFIRSFMSWIHNTFSSEVPKQTPEKTTADQPSLFVFQMDVCKQCVPLFEFQLPARWLQPISEKLFTPNSKTFLKQLWVKLPSWKRTWLPWKSNHEWVDVFR